MRRSLAVLILVSMATIATLALISAGLSHVQAMRENAGFMGSMGHHMGQDNHMGYDENTSTHMNVTQHMQGDMYTECSEMHNRMNMTDHMSHMH
jgi:hypothetical protein